MSHDAVILAAVRTPFGRYNGILKDVRPDDLAALVIREAALRAGVEPGEVEDVILGCANQAGEDNRNVARMALLLAGFPVEVAGQTVNRLCGSSLQAVCSAAQAIAFGAGDVFIAGGVESMTRAPLVMGKPESAFPRGDLTMHDTTLGWRFINPKLAELYPPYSMGETAENIATSYHISRSDQDLYALRSHQRAIAAVTAGRMAEEIIPVSIPQKKGEPHLVLLDEHPRADTSVEALGRLKPAFRVNGTVTAGNAAGINDGAAALVVTSADWAEQRGIQPLARLLSLGVSGVDPAYMGLGPIPASRKALARAGLSIADMDLIEINEAFACQVLECARELEIDLDRLNVNGGAIALGHPLGASGARILGTLIHELRRRAGRYGLASMCIGVGQGIAVVVERL